MTEHRRAWLTLAQAYLRVAELESLLDRFGTPEGIVTQGRGRLLEAGLTDSKAAAIAEPDKAALDRALQWLDVAGHHLLTWGADDYPPMLTQIAAPPLLLYVNGDVEALHLPSLAMVGSRNPTSGGVRNASDFARHLAGRGFIIVSGLAQGIDTASHRGALEAAGRTVAVLGHGIDRVYPAANRELAHAIARQGALVTEYPPGTAPERRHFPERNRLISGLSLGTLVVEAARRSGSLITARLAAEQGREVFAIPGSIHNALSRGCHELIRQGAKLVEAGDDIVAELRSLTGHMQESSVSQASTTESLPPPDEEYQALRELLGHDPVTIDQLEKASGLTIDQLSSMLLILELRGEVEALSGGRYVLLA